jgi:hypothetical protein
MELTSAADFRSAVDLDLPGLEEKLGVRSRIGHASQLEELAQADRVIPDLDRPHATTLMAADPSALRAPRRWRLRVL